jgi:hypothetical protein
VSISSRIHPEFIIFNILRVSTQRLIVLHHFGIFEHKKPFTRGISPMHLEHCKKSSRSWPIISSRSWRPNSAMMSRWSSRIKCCILRQSFSGHFWALEDQVRCVSNVINSGKKLSEACRIEWKCMRLRKIPKLKEICLFEWLNCATNKERKRSKYR